MQLIIAHLNIVFCYSLYNIHEGHDIFNPREYISRGY